MYLEKRIELKLSEYVGFDIKEIINERIDMTHVFGGAVRDILAEKKIHDVDILCMFESMRKIIPILEKNGYMIHSSLSCADIQSMYSTIHVIIEPKTFIKVVDGEIRIIQLIRPGNTKLDQRRNYRIEDKSNAIRNFHYILGQVDMSNCAVHYSYEYNLKESVHGAVNDCLSGHFDVLETEMKTDRFHSRKEKFISRGWVEKKNLDKKQFERTQKIKKLINGDTKNYFMPTPGVEVRKEDTKLDEFGLNDLF